MADKFVYDFSEGNKSMRELLGGKGANLAEMTVIGLPVPPGFTITTEVCNHYSAQGEYPAGLKDQVESALALLEKNTGKTFGDPNDPLLVSVRSGARASMPGMMDTILNLGLNDTTVQGLIKPRPTTRASATTATGASSACTATSCWARSPRTKTIPTRSRSASTR